MKYIFKGNLSAALCAERVTEVQNTLIRLYRFEDQSAFASFVAAQPKETYQIVEGNNLQKNNKLLLAETQTDESGNYVFEIDGDKTNYEGGPVVFMLYFPEVPDYGQGTENNKKKFKAFAYVLNIMQPKWRETNEGLMASWNYRIPTRVWCYILSRLDIWFIYGKLTVCQSQVPIPGIEIIAMDDDVISDDKLGSAITDSNGNFLIVYTSKMFKKTFLSPWINIETPVFPLNNGPDIYFKYAIGGSVFEKESPSRARQPDRENVGNCFCVNLCLKEGTINIDPDDPIASFFSIGNIRRYHILNNIDSLSGKTKDKSISHWNECAFFSSLTLIGSLSKKLNSKPLEYLFEIREYDQPGGLALGGWTEVDKTMMGNCVIGYKQEITSDPANPVKITEYAIHPEPGQEEVFHDGNWIKVPQVTGFIPNADAGILTLKTHAFTGGDLNMTGLAPGNSTATVQPLQTNRYFSIRLKKREQANSSSAIVAGTSKPIAIFNRFYENVPQHGSWLPGTSRERGVACIDLLELSSGGGCAKITNSLHVKYTATNPNLGNVILYMLGPGGPHAFAPVVYPTPGEEAHGTSAYSGSVASLPNCSYIVKIRAELKLTNGEHQHHNIWDEVAFCK